jgi:uncharacterized protein YndB with AHSA1/START domain
MKKDDPAIVVTQKFNVPPQSLWRAITEVEKMTKWFFEDIPEFKAEIGFKTEFNVNTGERDFLHKWQIIDVFNEKIIKYDWSYPGYNGRSIVTFEIYDIDSGSELKLTNTIVEDFQSDIPEFNYESCVGGWKYFINERLPQYLNEQQI